MAHIDAMHGLGAAVMRGIALGLRLPESFFADQNRGAPPYWCTRVIHYPPLAAAPDVGDRRAAERALAGVCRLLGPMIQPEALRHAEPSDGRCTGEGRRLSTDETARRAAPK